jgi:hypothetical protein
MPKCTLLTTKKKNGSRFGWIDRCGLDGFIHQAVTSSRHIGTIVPQTDENFNSFRLSRHRIYAIFIKSKHNAMWPFLRSSMRKWQFLIYKRRKKGEKKRVVPGGSGQLLDCEKTYGIIPESKSWMIVVCVQTK